MVKVKYDIGDIIKLCNENPMNSVWQIIELSTGKVFPVTGFSGTFGSISFSCNYEQKEDSKQQTSKAVVKEFSEYNKDQVIYCTIWDFMDNGHKYTWRDFHVRDLVYSDKVFTLFIDNRNGIR